MNWTPYLFLSIISLVTYNLLQKISASKIGTLSAIPFLAIGIIIVTVASYTTQRFLPREELFTYNGALLAVGVGLFWGIAQIFVYLMYKNNAPLSIGFPLLLGG